MKKTAWGAAALLLAGTACAQTIVPTRHYTELGWSDVRLTLGGPGGALKSNAGMVRAVIGRHLHPNLAVEGIVGVGARPGHAGGIIPGPPAPPPPPPGPSAPPLPPLPPPTVPDVVGLHSLTAPTGPAANLAAGDLSADAFGATAAAPFSAHLKVRQILGVFLKPHTTAGPVELFARIGYAHTRIRSTVMAAGVTRSTPDSSGDFAYGVGLGYPVAPTAYIGLDLMRYHDRNGSRVEGASIGIGAHW